MCNVPFDCPSVPLPPRLSLPDKPGIYFAIGPNEQVLYIGRALSLLKRWRTHHRRDQLAEFGDVRIAWVLLPSSRLVNTERELIKLFNPPLNNETHTDARDCDIDPQRMGEVFQLKRRDLGLTQAKVAAAVGVQKAAISKIEVGQGLPSANILARLCELYGVGIDEITNRPKSPELDAA
jgi:DNA-binding XRE family transcriptional regulator